MRRILTTTVLGLLLGVAVPAHAGDAAVDVERYDIDVAVHDDHLALLVTVRAVVRRGALELVLAPAMQVEEARVGKRIVEVSRKGDRLAVELPSKRGEDAVDVTLRVRGAPRNQFSEQRGGYLRTAVTPEHAWIRKQYAWYPRVPNDPALFRVSVDARADWKVRTAGAQVSREERDARAVWTFEAKRPTREIGLVVGPYVVHELRAEDGFVFDAYVLAGDEEGAAPLLEAARRAYDHYSSRLGPVDLERFTLVEMPAAFGKGSGYGESGYVLIGKGAFEARGEAPWAERLVAHEVAHTWWGGEVPFGEFASESLACYAVLDFLVAGDGEDAARLERQRAVDVVLAAADAGKEIALADIGGFGGELDPQTYRSHAYEKSMLLLAMIEDAVGPERMRELISAFVEDRRGELSRYADLRAALAKGGSAARTILTQWENPGIPSLTVEHAAKKSSGRWRVKGTLTQAGTRKPFKMSVAVVAVKGTQRESVVVDLSGRKASFSMTVAFEPEAVLVDPDYRVLAAAPRTVAIDAGAILDAAFDVAGTSRISDRRKCEEAIGMLRRLLSAGAGKSEALCHTGIGRCLFRIGEFDEARKELATALKLGAGGPFHRSWIHLRLGCIADLEKDRKRAVAEYEKACGPRASGSAKSMAQRFLEKPYRGHAKDG